MTNRISRRMLWIASAFLGSLVLAMFAQAQHPHKHQGSPGFYDFQRMSRSSVFDPFLAQAQNGQVLDQTLWNHHYQDAKEELHSSGCYLLDRLARRSFGETLELHLQTARDFSYQRQHQDKYQKLRGELDVKRVRAIVEYMSANHPEVTFTVRVIDPAPVGMIGLEAAKAGREVNDTSRGIIPPELRQGLGTYLRSIAGGGGGEVGGGVPFLPSPVSEGTSDIRGAFGADAAKPPPSPFPGAPPAIPPPSGPPLP